KDPWEKTTSSAPVAKVATLVGAAPTTQSAAAAAPAGPSTSPPVLPSDVTQFYVPVAGTQPGRSLQYQPWLLGFAEVVFAYDKRSGAEHREVVKLLAQAPGVGHPVNWDAAYPLPVDPAAGPEKTARWASVPESIDTGRKIKALEKAYAEYLAGARK